jgi:hypothetical protein
MMACNLELLIGIYSIDGMDAFGDADNVYFER